MKALISMMIAVVVASSLAGCIVRTRPHNHNSQRRVRDCPPAYHWDGGACVHNGRGKHKHKHRR